MAKLSIMKVKKFREYQPDQQLLFPPSVKDWVPEGHPAHFINEAVDSLDLSAIYGDYNELRCYPPYEPRMMVKVLIYAYSKGIRSSRKIERALYDDVALRFLSCNQQPDHWTISEFRRRHLKALGELLVQSIQMADKAGLVKLNQVAIDGTKIKANASKHSAMSYAYMKKEEERLRKEIENLLKDAERIDREEDRKYGNRRGDELPEELSTREKRLEAIKKAKAEIEAEARERAEQEQAERQAKAETNGKKYKRRKDANKAEPKMKAQRNFTDSDSRIMRNSDKAFIQGYNAQASVDAETQIIVAADVCTKSNDVEQLTDQVNQVIDNTGFRPVEVSADAGYYSEDNLTFLEQQGVEAFIPPDKIKHSEWRTQKALRGRIPKDATRKYLMRRKLRTKHGRERYRLRQTSVEPVFGFIKEQLGLRQFLLRGIDKVRSSWRFICAIHNLLKIFRLKNRLQTA